MRALAKVRPLASRSSLLADLPFSSSSLPSLPLLPFFRRSHCARLHTSQLVQVNNPDKIVFVGEALVGNEAVDQLSKFNRSLRDFSGGAGNPRGIDGMILTK